MALLQIVGGDKLIIPLLMELHMNPFKGRHFSVTSFCGRTLVLQIRHQRRELQEMLAELRSECRSPTIYR
nr:Mobile element protein [Escherichia coli O25b:H4-ST131]